MKTLNAILIGWGLCLSLKAADTPSNMGASPLDDSRAAIAQKDWAGALQRLRSLTAVHASSADFHNLMGYVLRHQNQPDMAAVLDHYDRALAIDPGHRAAREYLSEAWLLLNCPAKATEQLTIIGRLCGSHDCEEWKDLQQAIHAYRNPAHHACTIPR